MKKTLTSQEISDLNLGAEIENVITSVEVISNLTLEEVTEPQEESDREDGLVSRLYYQWRLRHGLGKLYSTGALFQSHTGSDQDTLVWKNVVAPAVAKRLIGTVIEDVVAVTLQLTRDYTIDNGIRETETNVATLILLPDQNLASEIRRLLADKEIIAKPVSKSKPSSSLADRKAKRQAEIDRLNKAKNSAPVEPVEHQDSSAPF